MICRNRSAPLRDWEKKENASKQQTIMNLLLLGASGPRKAREGWRGELYPPLSAPTLELYQVQSGGTEVQYEELGGTKVSTI